MYKLPVVARHRYSLTPWTLDPQCDGIAVNKRMRATDDMRTPAITTSVKGRA
jgi:hypothetical protein